MKSREQQTSPGLADTGERASIFTKQKKRQTDCASSLLALLHFRHEMQVGFRLACRHSVPPADWGHVVWRGVQVEGSIEELLHLCLVDGAVAGRRRRSLRARDLVSPSSSSSQPTCLAPKRVLQAQPCRRTRCWSRQARKQPGHAASTCSPAVKRAVPAGEHATRRSEKSWEPRGDPYRVPAHVANALPVDTPQCRCNARLLDIQSTIVSVCVCVCVCV